MTTWFDSALSRIGGRTAAIDQRIPWRPPAWSEVAGISTFAAEAVGYLSRGSADGIRREDVRAVRRELGALSGFVAAMIWGFGTTAYGARRATKMLSERRDEPAPSAVIEEIMSVTRSEGAAAGFGALWHGGRTRVHGLGTAFGTKALYFAADDATPGPRPLVLDQFVHTGAQTVSEGSAGLPVPDPRQYLTRARYEAYCLWAGELSATAGVPADCVEYALFKIGKGQLKLKD